MVTFFKIEHPDLNNQTPKEFIQSIVGVFKEQIPRRKNQQMRKTRGLEPLPGKSYADFKFTVTTRQK